eukprot:CFRG6684T1
MQFSNGVIAKIDKVHTVMGIIVGFAEYWVALAQERPEVVCLLVVVCFQSWMMFRSSYKNLVSSGEYGETAPVKDTNGNHPDDVDVTTTPNESDEGEEQHIPFKPKRYPQIEMINRSKEFYHLMNNRRSVRDFSTEDVPREVIDNIIRVGGTGPSGAHTEPWTYVVVRSSEMKRQVRDIIEAEERINYERRMGQKWVDDLSHIGTTWSKPYLEECPYLVIVFKSSHSLKPDGSKKIHYYHEISSSIGVGFLLSAVQNAGLCSVTTTPMNAGPKLRALCGRPESEKVLVLLPLGYPRPDATVPDLHRKPLEDIMVVI